jgi:DNA-directed RNA polymerase subunit RPC12/RpoP
MSDETVPKFSIPMIPKWSTCPCNVCSAHLEFETDHAGTTIQCPHCNAETVLFVPPPAPVAAQARKPSRPFRAFETEPRRGLENTLEGAGIFMAWLGLLGGIGMIWAAVSTENLILGLLGAVAIVQGFVLCIVLEAFAEVLRLLKKSQGLPYSGYISEGGHLKDYRCSVCKHHILEDTPQCPGCGAKF